MAVNYSLDTNVVSDILREYPPVMKNLTDVLIQGSRVFIDSIVYYEIVRGLQSKEYSKRLNKFHKLYESFPHLYFDRDNMKVAEKAAEIYEQLRHGHNVEDNDIFIAAMAMVNGCTLVTANEKHFSRIEGLRYINWRS
ncbi:MAG: DUF4411 family protein [Selenomonadaceae bacterium]|nr:DUF4411 family protein [Selenomonadaceae bacterium]